MFFVFLYLVFDNSRRSSKVKPDLCGSHVWVQEYNKVPHEHLLFIFFFVRYGCPFGAKFMFLYSEKDFYIQRKFSYLEEILLYSEKVLYLVNFFVFQKMFIFNEILLCSVTFLLHSDKFFIFRKNFVFKETFYIQRKSLCSEKIFIFRENVDIQRKCERLSRAIYSHNFSRPVGAQFAHCNTCLATNHFVLSLFQFGHTISF